MRSNWQRRSIENGDVWGGLARLRRFMEIRFNELFPKIDSERMSLSGFIELAHRRGMLKTTRAPHFGLP